MKKVLVGGIGNVLLGDDGVGPYIARLLSARYEFDQGVEVADLGTPALDLIDQISGRDGVILIDSVKSNAVPGTVQIYPKEQIVRSQPEVRMDPHSPALVEALLATVLFGVPPEDLVMVGVVGESYTPSCCLSAAVKASVPRAIAEVLRQLDRLGVRHNSRKHHIDPDTWWVITPSSDQMSQSDALPGD